MPIIIRGIEMPPTVVLGNKSAILLTALFFVKHIISPSFAKNNVKVQKNIDETDFLFSAHLIFIGDYAIMK